MTNAAAWLKLINQHYPELEIKRIKFFHNNGVAGDTDPEISTAWYAFWAGDDQRNGRIRVWIHGAPKRMNKKHRLFIATAKLMGLLE